MAAAEDATTLLLREADTGDLDAAQLALAATDVLIDAVDESGQTALCKAARHGHLALVDALLAARCDVDKRCDAGWTPLGYAVSSGHIQAAETLAAAGANVDNVTACGDSVLMCAIRHNRQEILDALLASNANVSVIYHGAESARRAASRENVQGVVQKLPLAGADVHHVNVHGDTALSVAAAIDREDVVATLLSTTSAGDNAEPRKWNFDRALTAAIDAGSVGIVKRLLDAGADPDQIGRSIIDDSSTVLVHAARKGKVDIVRLLLDAGADVTKTNDRGETALTSASSIGSTEMVEMLLNTEGIDLEHADNDGNTALMIAIDKPDKSCVDVIHILLAAGANVHHVNKRGLTALIHASRRGQMVMVESLLAKGAAVDVVTRQRCTVLHYAVRSGNVHVVEKLLSTGDVDVNFVGDDEDSSLTIAADENHDGLVQLLLAHGADVDHVQRRGLTALTIASIYGYENVVATLLNAGADVIRLSDHRRSYTAYPPGWRGGVAPFGSCAGLQ